MARTLLEADDIASGALTRALLNTTTPGSAVIAKVIAGAGVSLAYTGADAGTGDVTIAISTAKSSKTAAYSVVAGDCGATIILGGAAYYAVTFPTPGSIATGFYRIVNNDSRAKKIILTGGVTYKLWPGQSDEISNITGSWEPLKGPQRYVQTGTHSIYVNPTSGVADTDGLASGSSAFNTFAAAYADWLANYDAGGFYCQFNLAAGTTFTSPGDVAVIGLPPGGVGCIIDGGGTSAGGGALINPSSGTAAQNAGSIQYIGFSGNVTIQNLSVDSAYGSGVVIAAAGELNVGSNVYFGACLTSHTLASGSGSVLYIFGPVYVTGNSFTHNLATQLGFLIDYSSTTFVNAVTFSYYVYCTIDGVFQVGSLGSYSTSFVNPTNVTGGRYWVGSGGVISGVAGNYTYFPGTTAGGGTGGTYDGGSYTVNVGAFYLYGPSTSAPPALTFLAPANAPCEITGDVNGQIAWVMNLGDGTTQSGSNVGADFGIFRYSDAGALIDQPLKITRSTGVVSAMGAGGLSVAPSSGAVDAHAVLSKASGLASLNNRIWGETAGSARWELNLGSQTSESGSNAGSDFAIGRYSDAGTLIDYPLSIVRSSGQVTVTDNLSVLGTTYLSAAGLYVKGSSTGYTGLVSANASATTYTLTLPPITDTVAALTATQTLTNKTLALTAGTASAAPLTFSAGTNLTAAAAGTHEYDGSAFYATPTASCRGVMRTEQVMALSGAYTLTSQTAAQKLLNGTTNGALTLPVGPTSSNAPFRCPRCRPRRARSASRSAERPPSLRCGGRPPTRRRWRRRRRITPASTPPPIPR